MRLLSNKGGYVAPNEPPEVPPELQPFIPTYSHYEDGLHHELLRDLNSSLVELFTSWKHKRLDFLALMVKLCHNLLVSSAPPNVQTMNILLLGFYSSDKYRTLSSSQARHLIIDWLIYICLTVKIRPNEITCSTILATYRRRGMRTAFTEFILLMRGSGGPNALMFTKPLSLTSQSAARLTPTLEENRIFKQAVYPSPMIFAEVIKGVAKFYNLHDAVAICKEFTAKEWGYDWSCLRYLLQSCIIQKDWDSGMWVWDEIRKFREAGHKEPVGILAAVLALCVQCGKEDMFAEILRYANSQHRFLAQQTLVEMATGVLDRAIDRMDEEQLLALQMQDEDEGAGGAEEAERGVYNHEPFQSRVQRRLDDDPVFRRAVFGFAGDGGGGSAEAEYRWFDRLQERDEEYRYRSLRVGDVENSEEQEIAEDELEGGSVEDGGGRGSSHDDAEGEHDLLKDAEGGVDVEEVERRQHFGDSPVEVDGPLTGAR
jgi:hypothetical protein